MSSTPEQNFKNHTKFDPVFHFFLAPIAFFNIVYAIDRLVRVPNFTSAWILVLSIAALVTIVKMRLYSLKVQDRVIRLEERLRLYALLRAEDHARIPQLTEAQLVGLRFASDAELPKLALRAVQEKLTLKQIKQAVTNWRADQFRV